MTLDQMIKHLDNLIINKNIKCKNLKKEYDSNFDLLYHEAKYLPIEEIDKLLDDDVNLKKELRKCKKDLEMYTQLKEWLIELKEFKKE